MSLPHPPQCQWCEEEMTAFQNQRQTTMVMASVYCYTQKTMASMELGDTTTIAYIVYLSRVSLDTLSEGITSSKSCMWKGCNSLTSGRLGETFRLQHFWANGCWKHMLRGHQQCWVTVSCIESCIFTKLELHSFQTHYPINKDSTPVKIRTTLMKIVSMSCQIAQLSWGLASLKNKCMWFCGEFLCENVHFTIFVFIYWSK